MPDRIPIKGHPVLSEWYNTGFDAGRYHAWLHGKNCPDSSCRCIALLQAVCNQIEIEEDWKVFITRVGWLAGFSSEREGNPHEYDGEDQADRTEAGSQPS